ncbi:MAG: hypothetical protein ABSB23_13465 [Bryobacteraceae bacterium]|jgi:hypothetical protein
MVVPLLVLTLALSSFALAQGPGAGTPPAKSKATSGPSSPQWHGLSAKEKLRYDARHLFDLDNIAFAALGAGFDQLRERPGQWGDGGSAFGQRFGSHWGQYVVQRSIMFPVQLIDHEDTRYFRSTSTGYKRRFRDAVLQTIWRHDDSGGRMPAYSEFLGDYGAAAVSRMWWPYQYHNGSAIFIAGSDTIMIDAGINVLHEFWPDLKRWLRFKHRASQPPPRDESSASPPWRGTRGD